MIEYSTEIPKVYLLALHDKSVDLNVTLDSLREMRSMATTLDYEVVGEDYQTRAAPDPKSYLGKGKLMEIKDDLKDKEVTMVLFDHELTPKQGQYLEKELGCMVWDRTQLILEIFASHAATPESKNQVELAQLKYMLPRLVGMWAHLDREKGGIGTSKGMGEKQINIDRTLVRKRISRIEKYLKKVERERETQSKQRSSCFQIGVVGYTNAGKTTLVNRLAEAELLAQDKLFATLESTTRLLKKNGKPDILISDTVGFIRNLPHNLVASFRSTLSVVRDADLLLHVVDSSSENIEQHIATTESVLEEIEAADLPRVLVFNKVDCVEDHMDVLIMKKTYPNAIFVSAFEEDGVESLRKILSDHFAEQFVRKETVLGYNQTGLLDKFYQLATIEEVDYKEDGIHVLHATTSINTNILEKLVNGG